MTLTLKGIFKSLKLFTKKFVVKEREELEIGYPTDVLHVAHVGFDDSSAGGPSWMKDYKRAPNFPKTFGTLGEVRDPSPQAVADTSSSSSQGSQPSPVGAVQVPKKLKQKKIKSSPRQSKASKSKSSNEKEITPVAQV